MSTKANLKQLFLYLLIGGGAAVLDYGTFFLLEKNVTGIGPELASLSGQVIGFLFSFFLNTYLNFKKSDKLFKRFLLYFTIVLIGMTVSTIIISIFKTKLDIYLLKFICLIFVSILQFILNKLITYKN